MAVTYKVPFIANPNDECVPCSIGMIIKYFEPDSQLSKEELFDLTGYVKGMGAWQTKHMLELAKRGYQIRWIEDFDWQAFIDGPGDYLRKILKDPEALHYQLTKTNLSLEADRMKQYLSLGYSFEMRKGTVEDIKHLLDTGWLVRLEVNAMPLRKEVGYIGHSILVVGYDTTGIFIHNPDGPSHNKANQYVPFDELDQAWREFGGSYSLYAFKK